MQVNDVKAAVKSAIEYLKSLEDEISNDLQDLRLEETELSPDEKYWLITLGYDVPIKNRSGIEKIMSPYDKSYKREYKLFKVNSENHQVEAMKIRVV